MKKLALLVLLICTLIGIVPITARIVGPTHPVSLPVQLLGLVNCDQPCVLGLTLGKTTFADARRLLSSFQLPEGVEATVQEVAPKAGVPFLTITLRSRASADPIEMEFYFRDPDRLSMIGVATKSYSRLMPTLAEIKELYGTPRCALSDGGSAGAYIFLPGVDSARNWSLESRVDLYYSGGKPLFSMPLDWNQPVTGLTFFSRIDTTLGINICGKCTWHGLAQIGNFMTCHS